jgi:hypothetical protein
MEAFLMPENLTARQRQTLNARTALAARFPNDEAKSEHYRDLAEKANAGRVVLSGEEAQRLASAYELLRGIGEKARAKVAQSADESS